METAHDTSPEKENLSPNDDIIPSSQGSLTFNEPNTQRLCLELEDETQKFALETQMTTPSPQGGSGEKRKADGHMSDLADMEVEKKTQKLDQDKSGTEEGEDMFSDVEIINVSEDNTKSIEIVTLNDTINESPKKSDESKDNSDHGGSLKADFLTKAERKDDSDILAEAEDNSSMKESSTEDVGKLDVNLDNANAMSTPDQGRLRQANGLGQKNTSSEDSQVVGQEETLKMTSSPEENGTLEITETFKTPQEEDTGLVIAICKPSEFRKLSESAKIEEHFFIPQKKIPQDFTVKLKKFLTNNKNLARRLSDLSGLSAGSSGYNADTSSVGTGSGSSSNRDRLSIMPETLIEPHKVLSPLPKRLWPRNQRNAKQAIVENKSEETCQIKIKDNVKVFAKWVERTDVKFWPGIIKEQEEPELEDKYIVIFDDGYEKSVKKEDVVRADSLIPGCQINVEKEEGVHQVGVLLAYPDCSQSEIFYTVQLEDMPDLPETEAEAISYKNVHLTLEQRKNFQAESGLIKNMGKKSSDVSLDNLVSGKRRSKSVTPIKTPTKKRTKKGGEHVETSAQSESDRTSQMENTSDEDKTPKRTRMPRKPLFKNMCFLLTQAKEKSEEQDVGESAMESETEDEAGEKLVDPKFNRKDLKKKIQDNGGQVLTKFPGEKEKIPEHVIVISDRMCRTMTYLLSIAYGFERVNFMWIQNCITAKELLPRQNYTLQVGFSSHLNRDVEQLEIKGNRRDLLKGLHILIATSEKEFGEDWKPILTRLGASVSVRTQGKLDKSLKKIDTIIANSTPPFSIVKDAREKDLFLVTSKWVVESLINGKVIPYGDYLI